MKQLDKNRHLSNRFRRRGVGRELPKKFRALNPRTAKQQSSPSPPREERVGERRPFPAYRVLPVLVAVQPGGGAPVLRSSKLTVSARAMEVARLVTTVR